jgi:hypothetical protein
MDRWMVDAFFWVVLPIALFEGVRIALRQRARPGRSLAGALGYGALDAGALGLCAATGSPWVFLAAAITRLAIVLEREREWRVPGAPKTALIVLALVLLIALGGVRDLGEIASASAELDGVWRVVILALLSAACVIAILPVRVSEEPKETLAAPLVIIAFARIAVPLGSAEPRFAVVVPVLAVLISLISALWLLSAGRRANHFEPEALVSELLVCERGVVLGFVWLGLASGDHLAGVGALLLWWSGVLALLALEASLRRRPLVKPMAFFALAMTLGLPGTVGFVAEDLLAHGLLELRPMLAAAFVAIAALNATALYLALVNIIVDTHTREAELELTAEARPSLLMLGVAGLSLLIGLVPRPFVAEAAAAHDVIVAQTRAATPAPATPWLGALRPGP